MSSVRCSEGRVLDGARCALGGTGVFRSSVQIGSCCVWRGGGSLPLEWLLLTSLAEQGGGQAGVCWLSRVRGAGKEPLLGVWGCVSSWGCCCSLTLVLDKHTLVFLNCLAAGELITVFRWEDKRCEQIKLLFLSCPVCGGGGMLGGRSHSRFWVVVGSAWAGSAVSLPDMSMSPLLQPSGSLPSPVPAPLGTVGTLAPLRGLAAPAGVLRPPGWEPGSPGGCGAAAGTQVRLRKPLRARGAGRLRCRHPDRSVLPTCFCQLKKLLLFSIFHCIYSLLLFLGGSVINLSFLLCLADLKNRFNCC